MRLAIAGLMAVLAASPAVALELTEEQVEVLTRALRDPLSAQFRNIRKSERHDFVICGEMNAKNAYGGYVGFRRFWMDIELNEYEIEPEQGYMLTSNLAGCT